MWGLGFIWNSEDVETLKRDHNIHGSAVGACPGHQQQNDVHGLPVQIQAEAVQYLLEKGVVEIDCGKRGDGESPPDVADEAFMKRWQQLDKVRNKLLTSKQVNFKEFQQQQQVKPATGES